MVHLPPPTPLGLPASRPAREPGSAPGGTAEAGVNPVGAAARIAWIVPVTVLVTLTGLLWVLATLVPLPSNRRFALQVGHQVLELVRVLTCSAADPEHRS